MLERDLAKCFATIFKDYTIWIPANRSAGWPDRGIQIHSYMVWFELKIIKLHQDSTIRVNNLEPEQAAWLSKWKRSGGHCHLFLGIIEKNNDCMFGVLGQEHWSNWLKVPYTVYNVEHLQAYVSTKEQIKQWFDAEYIMFK